MAWRRRTPREKLPLRRESAPELANEAIEPPRPTRPAQSSARLYDGESQRRYQQQPLARREEPDRGHGGIDQTQKVSLAVEQ